MSNNTPSIERIAQVEKRTSLPRASIYRLMKTGKFPKSIKLSDRATGWRSSDIDEWINELQVAEV